MTSKTQAQSLPTSVLDQILTAQIIVAWAGEAGEDPRLGWWRTNLVSEFGGETLFKQLLPSTWAWATLQAVREAARAHDASARSKDAEADRLVSLFALGFEVDEKLDERFQDLKRAGRPPKEALTQLNEVLTDVWSQDDFEAWVSGHGDATSTVSPTGRRLKGEPPHSHELTMSKLVAGLAPLAKAYPLPHFRRRA